MNAPRALAICGLVIVSGCAAPRSSERLECAASGGEWRKVCVAQVYTCVRPYLDAGKSCSGSEQCEGDCAVDMTVYCEGVGRFSEPPSPKVGEHFVGTCQVDDDPCSPKVIVEGGIVTSISNPD